jgi:hypothetical protein
MRGVRHYLLISGGEKKISIQNEENILWLDGLG